MKKSLVQFAYKLIPGTQKTDFMYPSSHYILKFFMILEKNRVYYVKNS